MLGKIAMNKSQRWIFKFAIMQADAQLAIADDGIFVRPDIAALQFRKAECPVKRERLDDVGSG